MAHLAQLHGVLSDDRGDYHRCQIETWNEMSWQCMDVEERPEWLNELG